MALPAAPDVTADLVAEVVWPALDGDGEPLPLSWSWWLDDVAQGDLSGPVVPRARLARGQAWTVAVGSPDGLAAVARTVVVNAPPVPGPVRVEPEVPVPGEPVACTVAWSDPDGDPLDVTTTWTLDGAVVGEGGALPAGLTVRGDRLTCTSAAHDGFVDAPVEVRAEVIAGNRPPVITLRLTPLTLQPGVVARCEAEAHDPDGDPVTLSRWWTLDGVPAGAGDTFVAPDRVGARLACEAEARDDASGHAVAREEARVGPPWSPHNVLVLIADDLGVDRIGAYGVNPTAPATPTLDRLVDEGIRFDRVWAAPTCSPSRAMLFTGRYPHQHGVGRPVFAWEPWWLQRTEVTAPELVKLASPEPYTAALIGKWHLGTMRAGRAGDPLVQGFDHYRGLPANFETHWTTDGQPQDYFSYEYSEDRRSWRRDGYLTTHEVDDAVEAVRSLPEPWLIYVGFHAAHWPPHVPPAHLYAGPLLPAVASDRAKHDAMTEALDTELARLLDAVDAERTTVIFLGDNGTPKPAIGHPYVPGENKHQMYEGGIRVPLVVRSPLVLDPGSRSEGLVSVVDLFATVSELAGVPPDHPHITDHTDSRSLVPYLIDPGRPSLRDVVFAERVAPNGMGPWDKWQRAVRDDTHKLLWEEGVGYVFAELRGGAWREGPPLDLDALSPTDQRAFDALKAVLDGPRFHDPP